MRTFLQSHRSTSGNESSCMHNHSPFKQTNRQLLCATKHIANYARANPQPNTTLPCITKRVVKQSCERELKCLCVCGERRTAAARTLQTCKHNVAMRHKHASSSSHVQLKRVGVCGTYPVTTHTVYTIQHRNISGGQGGFRSKHHHHHHVYASFF